MNLRSILARITPYLPSNRLRVASYRWLGYKVGRGVRIGIGTLIECVSCEIADGVVIGGGSLIRAVSLRIGPGTTLADGTQLTGRILSY